MPLTCGGKSRQYSDVPFIEVVLVGFGVDSGVTVSGIDSIAVSWRRKNENKAIEIDSLPGKSYKILLSMLELKHSDWLLPVM